MDIRQAAHTGLLKWFKKHKRDFPWRKNRTPYRVWVSELMLQQTRADQALPYYRKFMKTFPSLNSLAKASQHDVLKIWEGLGYYARARNMHKTAQRLVEHSRGRFPKTYEELKALPGIGPYTAAAIGSLAFDLDVAVVDGNVIRVLSRIFAYTDDVGTPAGKARIQSWAEDLLPRGRAGMFNEAMMELGAVLCLPKNPVCSECPLRKVCRGYASSHPERYPVKKKKAKIPHKIVGAAVVRNRKGEVLIARRPERSMLGGLWEFPGGVRERDESMKACIVRELKEELGIEIRVDRRLITVHHAYSHFTIELHVYWGRIIRGRPRAIQCSDYTWCTVSNLRTYPFSRVDLHVLDMLETGS